MTHTQRLIEIIRAKTGFSASKIAELANINQSQVTRWQTGQNIGFTAAIELCESLGLSLATLLKEISNSKECKRLTDCAMEKSASLTDEK